MFVLCSYRTNPFYHLSGVLFAYEINGRMGKRKYHFNRRLAMKGKIGCPTKIVTLPRCVREPVKHSPVELSEQAKHRLEALDWYYKKPGCYSSSGKPEAALTCRHFGVHRSQFYRWKNRFCPQASVFSW
jgi:hypothetical protein